MKIAIAGGKSHADFLIGSLKRERHRLVVINQDEGFCEYLASCHDIPIVCGDATKRYVLDGAEIEGFDVFVALASSDADNLVICQTVKRFYGVAKTVCTVNDPQNVAVFKRLGISIVLNETLIISEALKEASTVEALIENMVEVEREIYPALGGDFGPDEIAGGSVKASDIVPRSVSREI